MAEWNFDISQAPKGHSEEKQVKIGKAVVAVRQYHTKRIIAAGNGGVVSITKWLPKERRWEFFTEDAPPLAWQPMPDHPFPAQIDADACWNNNPEDMCGDCHCWKSTKDHG